MPERKKKTWKKGVPDQAIEADDPLGRVVFFGSKLKENVRSGLVSADLSMSTDMVTQLTLGISDPGFEIMEEGLFKPGIPVAFEDMMMEVASVDVSSEAGNEFVTVRCRSRAVRKLKKRRGNKVMRDASPTQFVRAEAKAVGLRVVAQPSPRRKQVARDSKGARNRQSEDYSEPPSSWTTFHRLAEELGFYMFESAGTLYFGKPSWLMERYEDDAFLVNWNRGERYTQTLAVPRCTKSADDDQGVTLDFELPLERGRRLRPGRVIKLRGVPSFNGKYIVREINYSLLRDDRVTIRASTPVDPEVDRRRRGGLGGGGYAGGGSLRQLLKYVGFKGEALEMAIAIVMAESGGDARAQGDTHLADSKWGNSVGLFQIRSLRRPGQWSGEDKLRVARKLTDAYYNARTAYKLSNGGKNWGAWSTYTNRSYRQYYRTGKSYRIRNWRPSARLRGSGRLANDGRRNSRSSLDFVSYCLRQAGDRYDLGAEVKLGSRNPSVWDCSELIQWACHQVGVYIPDYSGSQIDFCHGISVERAIRTRGALLWHPGHIAVSLGNGRTIEAANPGFGVGSQSARGRFQRGGLIPKMRY